MRTLRPVISIIVPIYNVGPYLEVCLNSLVNQTFNRIEIIIVNDGSTDNGVDIVRSYLACDNRIVFINQQNLGLSAARNAGLSIAEGKYVLFVDGDDWIDVGVCGNLIELASRYEADVVVYGLKYNYSSGIKYKKNYIVENVLSGEEYLLFSLKAGCYSPTVCNKLFRKSLVEKIKFPVGLRYEDIYFSLISIVSSARICSSGSVFYNYRMRRTGSITSKISIENFYDLKSIYREIYCEMCAIGCENIYHNKYFKSDLLARIGNEIIIKMFDGTCFENRDQIVEIMKNDYWFMQYSKYYLFSKLSFSHKINYWLFFNIKLFYPLVRMVYLFRVFVRGY
ncbi:MAG: glycosyltransferase family 2 protein [Desulfuromonadales bacterium]|nr:glycosyltransferase family 2 protein [Desulfuromonadales bacterium]